MAEYLSIGEHDAFTAMYLRDAVRTGRFPTIAQAADDSRYFPYRYGHAIWAYLTGAYGDTTLAPLFGSVLRYGWGKGFENALHVKFDTLSKAWQRTNKAAYAAKDSLHDTLVPKGKRIITGMGGYNLAPSVSPDGRTLAFIPTRDIFDFELYLADASTGKVVQKLTSSMHDQHFDEISYINSSGAWSPDGKSLPWSCYDRGKNSIVIFNLAAKKIVRTIAIRDVDAIYQLTWSPDGAAIAFFGTTDGYGRLYRYSFTDRKVTQLTEPGYTAIEPAWSPDGATIAFATDRGPNTDLDSLAYGPLRIGLLNVQSGDITTLAISDKASHTNPQFSPDGKSLYFIADPDGVANVYRYDFDSAAFYRITKVVTGVAGLTAVSPALTVAKNTGTLIFNVFEKGNYSIYSLPDSMDRGAPLAPHDSADFNAAVKLPPVKNGGIVDAFRADHRTFMPDTAGFRVTPYRPKLTSITEGRPTAAPGSMPTARITAAAACSCSATSSTTISSPSKSSSTASFRTSAGCCIFNQAHRFNWGASISHIPLYYGSASTGTGSRILTNTIITKNTSADSATRKFDTTTTSTTSPTAVSTLDLTRVYDDNVSLFAQYPLSTNRRLEFSAGATRYSYSTTEIVDTTDLTGDTLYNEISYGIPAHAPQNFFSVSAAYIGDWSNYGFTGPVSGKAYHFEITPTTGSLNYTQIIADYRYYWFLRPITIAFRALHVGLYGGGVDRYPLFHLLFRRPHLGARLLDLPYLKFG